MQAKVVAAFMRKMHITRPDDVVIAFGDGARNNVKGRAPGPSTSIRKLFQRNHFKVVDVGEAYTSMRCFHCKLRTANNEPCRKQEDKEGNLRDNWGLRRCKICRRPWSRDYQACLNIAHVALQHLLGYERPIYLGGGTLNSVLKRKTHTERPADHMGGSET